MALTKCTECQAAVSDRAKACPSCGAAVEKKHSRLQWVFIGVATVVMVSCIATQQTAEETRAAAAADVEAQKTPAQRAAEQTAKTKRASDLQRVVVGALALKKASKNPASFKLTNAIVTSAGAVCYEYSGTNSFNATVPGYAVQSAGQLLATDAAWNKHCAGKTGESFAHAKSAL